MSQIINAVMLFSLLLIPVSLLLMLSAFWGTSMRGRMMRRLIGMYTLSLLFLGMAVSLCLTDWAASMLSLNTLFGLLAGYYSFSTCRQAISEKRKFDQDNDNNR